MSEVPDSDRPAEADPESQAAIDLRNAVAAEERLLAGAP